MSTFHRDLISNHADFSIFLILLIIFNHLFICKLDLAGDRLSQRWKGQEAISALCLCQQLQTDKRTSCISQSCYMDLLKLLHGFDKVGGMGRWLSVLSACVNHCKQTNLFFAMTMIVIVIRCPEQLNN